MGGGLGNEFGDIEHRANVFPERHVPSVEQFFTDDRIAIVYKRDPITNGS